MTAPTEQQLKDPTWWDENAPENANWLIRPKRSNTKNEAFFAITNTGHVGTNCDGESYHVMFEHWHFPVHRPTKAAECACDDSGPCKMHGSPEWDGEFPSAGDWVEHWKRGDIETTRVIGFDGSLPICSHGEGKYYGVPRSMMRPLRTAEQRQREEIIDEAVRLEDSWMDARQFATKLYDAGMLRKGDE